MTKLNHYAIAAALGGTLGPKVAVSHGQVASPQLASTIDSLQYRRRHLWEHEAVAVHNASKQYFAAVRAAFLRVRDGHSVEKVIVDDEYNTRFVRACHNDFGINDSVFRLNLALLALRKKGALRGLRSGRGDHVAGQWRYAYASEMAAQTLRYKHGVTVDTLLCHPKLTEEFDSIAERLAPGFSAFEYRWTALNIRKKGVGKRVDISTISEWSHNVAFDAVNRVPDEEGVYTLREDGTCLFVGMSDDMSETVRCSQHIVEPGIFGAQLWQPDPRKLRWQFAEMSGTGSEDRYAAVRALVGEFRPIFNIPRGHRKPSKVA